MPRFVPFAQALAETATCKRQLLLGNGFSIALFPNCFDYRSLLASADFTSAPEARAAFDALNTTDFEVVIQALRHAVALSPVYQIGQAPSALMDGHSAALKELLVQSIAGKHPARPSDITEAQYTACRNFLSHFVGDSRVGAKDYRGRIYTLNYDLLLYWTLLHIDAEAPDRPPEDLAHDDGFRAPPDDFDAPYVVWEAEGGANKQNIHFLHGGLHLYDYGPELQKLCWERGGGVPLVDQIRNSLSEGMFPLFVAEGNTEGKLTRIRHSGYLQRSLKSFAEVMRGMESAVFVYGHSLAPNDEHVLRFIERGKIGRLYVSIYGDAGAQANRTIIERAERMAEGRHEKFPLEVSFFSAQEAAVWG
ncbi:DUF4917 family protein [Tardiphaga sp. vice304]|uniref:DUF4917 family protein n=1 Tax=Tardiphaga sp. vice304 TaxID=2592817 RepID=UPI001162631A|nr:DUF4917 family protein [Tardiphaga sp. vice304]QDM29390.1 DUF4917 family protein [Tardiphaga sp. vice304]